MEDEQDRRSGNASALRNVAVSAASTGTVGRFGSANAEYVKAYTGVDNELGKVLDKGLKGISKSKVHQDYSDQNIKPQAGFSAEVHKVDTPILKENGSLADKAMIGFKGARGEA